MSVPQRLTFVTLGARDLPALRRFYRALGWTEADGATDDFASFVCGRVRLALYPIDLLAAEAAPGSEVVAAGAWNGVTLALNVATPDEVDVVVADAVAAGAVPVADPVDRDWGGRSAYVADPEGNRWEVAWAPGLEIGAGAVLRAMVAAFATGELDDVASYVHADYLDHQGLDGQRPITGVDGFAHVVRVARAARPDLAVEIVDLVEAGDRAVARIGWGGDRETIDIVRIAGGRAVEHWGAVAAR